MSAKSDVQAIPDGYPQVIPYLSIDGASAAIDFYVAVFGATERLRMPGSDGQVGHAELEIGTSLIMLADAVDGMGTPAPGALGGSPVSLMVYVEDVDAVFARAIEAGSTAVNKVEDKFYGDRSGSFDDPFGHRWHVASHVEDVPEDEMAQRAAAAAGS